jgi:hypothetical protein
VLRGNSSKQKNPGEQCGASGRGVGRIGKNAFADQRCASRQFMSPVGKPMSTLKIGTRTFEASDARVVREAERMFKLSPERRAHRLEKAKTDLARAAGAKGGKDIEALPTTKRAAAIILSQGVNEI